MGNLKHMYNLKTNIDMKAFITLKNQIDDGSAKTITSNLTEFSSISNVKVDKTKSAISFNYGNADEALDMKRKLTALGFSLAEGALSLIGNKKSSDRFRSRKAVIQ
ncbi:hypothetical protein [Mangrovimonas aestuarii]|uniref:hypothetical protein n=1 Tax=Mangrovimonas aestuarii TaxID=3018443 RepID=UPI002378000C|nr:hypothetical protein [Mangrovimonas aestuarii]